jgi:hypothetical protein
MEAAAATLRHSPARRPSLGGALLDGDPENPIFRTFAYFLSNRSTAQVDATARRPSIRNARSRLPTCSASVVGPASKIEARTDWTRQREGRP